MCEAIDKIKGREAICAKDVDNVATIWETLIEDNATEKIRKRIREIDERINAMKVDMRKLSLQQKVIKNAEIKILHQEVQTLHAQEKAREAKLEGFQLEVENLIEHIQAMQ